jgi:hypothetical protein
MNKYLENQFDLLSAWMANKIDLEFFNYLSNRWEPLNHYNNDDLNHVLREVREAKPIIAPDEIYINIYRNGKMFAHATEKEAINSIDTEYRNEEVITVCYKLYGEV